AHEGTFYGKHVTVAPQVVVRKLATPLLLDGLAVSNTSPCLGEPVEVKVSLDASLDGSGAGADATSCIQAVVGPRQFVQVRDATGPRLVYASVHTADGRADTATVPVTLQDCGPAPGGAPPIALHFWPALSDRNAIELVVHDYDANGHEIPASGP